MLNKIVKTQSVRRRKAQAAAELAIFGALIIVILNMIISYGQRTMYNNEVKAEAFRKALQQAYYRNAPVSYRIRKDSRIGSAMNRLGQDAAASASVQVMWTKGIAGLQGSSGREKSFGFYEVNENVISYPKLPKWFVDDTGEEQVQWVPVSSYKENFARRTGELTREIKEEDQSEIRNIVETEFRDQIRLDFANRMDTQMYDQRESMTHQLPRYTYQGQTYDVEGTDYGVPNWVWLHTPSGLQTATNLTIEANQDSDGTIYYERSTPGTRPKALIRRREWVTEHGLEQEKEE